MALISKRRISYRGIEEEILAFDSIDDAIQYLLPKIRLKSRNFYEREIKEELEKKAHVLVDHHAGNGIHYTVNLIKE